MSNVANVWTLANLRAALATAGVTPRRSRGQNFMVDRNFLEFIVRTAKVEAIDNVLEIGSGPGQLTELLAQRAARVWAIEVDRRLADICASHVQRFGNVETICENILEERHSLNRRLIDRIARECAGGLKIVSNLPYSIAATVIVGALESRLPLSLIVVLTQYELALRLTAKPGSSEYGQLTVLVGALGDVRIVRKAPPNLFWPQPKVASALLTIVPSRMSLAHTQAYRKLKNVVHRLFKFRRKQISTALDLEGIDAVDICRKSRIDPTVRCESLDVAAFMRLAESIEEQY